MACRTRQAMADRMLAVVCALEDVEAAAGGYYEAVLAARHGERVGDGEIDGLFLALGHALEAADAARERLRGRTR